MKLKKDELIAENGRLSTENSLLAEAVNAIANGEKVWVGKRHHYSASLLHVNRAHGGIVLLCFCPPGQRPYSSAYYFEQWFHEITSGPCTMSEEALAVRELAYQCKQVAQHHQQQAA